VIPKKIHYCWFGPKPYSTLIKRCIETWKSHLPEYEFFFWNETNSPMGHDFISKAYSAGKYAFVSDFVRFWALYKEGGIYLDTDMFVLRSMDDLLISKCFFGWETSDLYNLSCGVIGCEAGNDFVREVIDYYNNLHFSAETIESLIVPRIVTRLYRSYKINSDIVVYPYDYFYPFPFEKRGKVRHFLSYATVNSYAIHLWNLSWVSPIDKVVHSVVRLIKKSFIFK